jgi:hypothetical protein
MNGKIQTKIRKKISYYIHRFEERTTRPKAKFLKDMTFGLIRSGHVHLAKIGKSLGEKNTKYKHTIKRLRRNIGRNKFDEEISELFLEINSSFFNKGIKYAMLDLTDIQKKYAVNMEYLDRVRDGDKGGVGNGYYVLNIFGASDDRRNLVPMYSNLYSLKKGATSSENKKILKASDTVFKHLDKDSQILVLDRGGDRKRLVVPFIQKGYNFIVRLKKQRHLLLDGESVGYKGWKKKVKLTQKVNTTKIERNGDKKNVTYKLGIKKVKLPYEKVKDKELWLLVSKKVGPGIGADEGYSYYLSYLPPGIESEQAMKTIFRGYGHRWKIEQYHRQIKVDFNIEEVQLKRYQALKTLFQLLMITCFFIYKVMKGDIRKLLFSKLTPKECRRLLNEATYFIYYKITRELSKIMCKMSFYRKILFKRRKKLPSLFDKLKGAPNAF